MKYESRWYVTTILQAILRGKGRSKALGTAKPSFLSRNLEDLLREGTENEIELHRMKASAFSIISGELTAYLSYSYHTR